MMTKLLKISALQIDEKERDIIENEFENMLKELEILLSFSENTQRNISNHTPYSSLRDDVIQNSPNSDKILSNSKTKNDNGFIVKKII